jgi:hypothetical protein
LEEAQKRKEALDREIYENSSEGRYKRIDEEYERRRKEDMEELNQRRIKHYNER